MELMARGVYDPAGTVSSLYGREIEDESEESDYE